MDNTVRDAARKIKAIITDVDGVLTDGSLYIGPENYELKRFSIHDGLAVTLIRRAKIHLAVISGRKSAATTSRTAELQIADVYQGSLNKTEPLKELLIKYALHEEEVAYIGDSYIDLPVLEQVGLSVTVPDAPDLLRETALYTTDARGGDGVLLEVIELILAAQGRLESILQDLRESAYGVKNHDR